MPKYYDDDGNEFELDQPINEIQEKVKSFEETNSALESLKTEKEELEEKIKGFEDKDFNFAALRKKAENEKEKLTETEKLLLEKDTQINELSQTILGSWKNNILNELVGSDAELKEKVEKGMDLIKTEAKTEEELREKARQSYILTTGTVPGNINQGIHNSFSNSEAPGSQQNKEKLSPEAKELGKAMGLNDEDFDKHEGKK